MPQVSDVVSVTATIAGTEGVERTGFGATLFITTDDAQAATGDGKVREFLSLDELTETEGEFGGYATTSQPYLAAQSYFAQQPAPKSLFVGRYLNEAVLDRLVGTTPSPTADISATMDPATLTASGAGSTPSTGTFLIGTDSITVTVAGGDTNGAAFAAKVQAAIRADASLANAEQYSLTYNASNRYVLSYYGPPTAANGMDSLPTLAANAVTGTLANRMGFDGSDTVGTAASPALTVNGAAVTGIYLTGIPDGNYSRVASELQARIRSRGNAGDSSISVSYDAVGNRFVLTGPSSDGSLTALTGVLASRLGLDDGEVQKGAAAETITALMPALRRVNDDWYWITVEESIVDDDDAVALSTWAEASQKQLLLDTHETTAIADTVTASTPLGRILDATPSRTALIYSATADYKALSLAARFSAVDFNGNNTAITAHFKTLPGRQADVLTTAQVDNLDGHRLNYYTPFGSRAIVAQGVAVQSGIWIDVRYWLDWFITSVQDEVFDVLTRENRVPQTRVGISLLKSAVSSVCNRGIRNGGIAPGRVSAQLITSIRNTTGAQDFAGDLVNGYAIYVSPLSTLTETELNAREIPPINVWLKGAGAVHSVDLAVTFN